MRYSDDMTTTTLDAIRVQLADGIRGYLDSDGPERTNSIKRAAEAIVSARENHFFNREGQPDLLGRSYEYRQFVKSALDEATVPNDIRPSLQAAIRHHVSPLLRDRHGAELESRGLTPGSSVERARRRRTKDAHTVALFSGGGPITDADDALTVVNLARLAVNRVDKLTGAGPAEVQEIGDAFTRLTKATRDAQQRIKG